MSKAPKPTAAQKTAEFLKGYAKGKPIKNFGGNFWGINRKRCTIIRPEELAAMEAAGLIDRSGQSFTVR